MVRLLALALGSGSWQGVVRLSARGSRLWLLALALGSGSGVLADVLVCLLDPWGPPDACPSALRCQRLTLSRRKGIYHLQLALASLERQQRCGKAAAVCGAIQVSAWPPCLASRCAAWRSKDVTHAQRVQLAIVVRGVGRVWAGVWPQCPAALCAVVGRVGFWILDVLLVARGSWQCCVGDAHNQCAAPIPRVARLGGRGGFPVPDLKMKISASRV